jgi:tetratricopeptide (TPR) repeat protein
MSALPRHLLIIGGSPDDRRRAARGHVPATHPPLALDTGALPFVRPADIPIPPPPRAIVLDDLERAFPDAQAGGTRLVLTQSTYLLQKWIDRLDEGDRIIATADRAALARCAPEAFQARGPWAAFDIIDLAQTKETEDTEEMAAVRTSVPFVPLLSLACERLASAFTASDPTERLRLCRDAASLDPGSAVACLALASACRESRDGAAARDGLDRAGALAPEWEAVAYESGKLWLVSNDMARARDAFQRAADLMPTFSAAWSNLGATLGELDEPAAALKAFRQALAHDPRGFTILNNIGVVCRELGRLDESAAAFHRVIAINPAFVFGHYNLGHTLFLAGSYPDALGAYEEGRRRDPQQNRRQGCRLAVVRFANGDTAGAERDLWRCANAAPPDEREELLLEAYEIAHALLTQHRALETQRAFVDRIGAEITKSE